MEMEQENPEYTEEEELGEYEEDDFDRLYALSEEAKEDVRRQLREMKANYRSIKQRNLEIPEQFRISENDLKLPREIFANNYKTIDEECDEVYRIHEYESAETIIQLDKIRKFYLDPIETPHIIVKDICHEMQVNTIRNRKITKEFQELCQNNLDLIEEECRILREKAARTETEEGIALPPIKRIYAKDIIGDYEPKLSTYDIETIHNIRHLEKRLEQRYQRECAWQVLMAKKIPPDFIPPEDEEELRQAKAGTGAFRLQNSENYVGEQITIGERRQKIIDMKTKIRERVSEFNKMVIGARDEKPRIIEECKRLEKEIKKIHVLLPEEYKRKIPTIYEIEPEEIPETLWDITLEQIQTEETAMIAAAGLTGVKDEIMEDYFGAKQPDKKIFDEDDSKTTVVPPTAATAARQAKIIDLENESVASHRCRKAHFNPQSELGQKRYEVLIYPRIYRQEALFNELLRIINYFHERVKYLYDSRVQLEIDTRVKTIGLLTSICELDIAKEFDAQEKEIMERLKAQQVECKIAKHHLDKVKKHMNKMETDIKKVESDIATINKEAEVTIGRKGHFQMYLRKVFKKKIKIDASDDEGGEEENEGEEQDNEEGDEEEGGDSEEEENSEKTRSLSLVSLESLGSLSQDSGNNLNKSTKQKMDLDICPELLDRNIYNKVCDLRLMKAQFKKELAIHQKSLRKVKKNFLEIEKVYLKYEGRLNEINEEVRILQRRKQKRMNDLKLMIILRADQIQCMDMDDIVDVDGNILEKIALTYPGSGNVIIFPKDGSEDLEKRSGELAKKAKDEKDRCKLGKQMLVRLREELKKAERNVEEYKGKVKKEMILKFGQEVDLDKITAVIINLELLDQEILLDRMKNNQYSERVKVTKNLSDVRYELTKKIKENSKYNMLKAMMLERKRDLEYYIWKNEKAKASDISNILDLENGGGDMVKRLEDVISESQAATSESRSKESDKLEREIQTTKAVLKKQTERIAELKEVLRKCRVKTGLPPLIPLCQRLDSSAEIRKLKHGMGPGPNARFMRTAKEMPELNQYCPTQGIQCGVQTLYKGNSTLKLDKSLSYTMPSLEDVDKKAENETDKIFRDEVDPDVSYDYSSGGEDEGETEEAVKNLRETFLEIFPGEEEQEFMQYMEEAEMEEMDENEIYGKTNEFNLPPIKRVSQEPNSSDEPKINEDSEEVKEESKSLLDSHKFKKSVMIVAAEKTITEHELLRTVKKYSMGAGHEMNKDELDTMEEFQ